VLCQAIGRVIEELFVVELFEHVEEELERLGVMR
jgi:hypothetical protein